MKFNRNLGMLLLAVWFIAWGALRFIQISFIRGEPVMAVLAIVVGILLLLGR
jgi:hypothetical protein